MMPACLALPSSEMSSTEKNSGKIVTMSIRMRPTLLGWGVGSRGIRRLRGIGVCQLLEEPGRRRHRDGAGLEVDLGNDRRDERHHDLATGGLHDQEVLCGKVIDVGDLADLLAVAKHGEADELVVVPSV